MQLMDALLSFAAELNESARPRPAALQRLMQRWSSILRRMLPPHDFSDFAPQLFAVLTAELDEALRAATACRHFA